MPRKATNIPADTKTTIAKPVAAEAAAFASPDLAETGNGLVLIARPVGKTHARLATFVVDVHCLGVRKVTLSELPLAVLLNQALSMLRVAPIAPPVALAILDGSIAYAKKFGFSPPVNLAEGMQLFGDIEAGAVPFPFGKDGQVFYTQQHGDTDEFAEAVLAKLEKKPGHGNFGYELNEPGEEWVDDGDSEGGGEPEETADEE